MKTSREQCTPKRTEVNTHALSRTEVAYLNLGARPGPKAREGELARLQTQYAELQQHQKLAVFALSDAELEAVLAAYPLNNSGRYVAVQDWPSGSCWARSVIRLARLGSA